MKIAKKALLSILALVLLFWVGCAVYAYWPTAEKSARSFARAGDRFVQVDGLALCYRPYHRQPHPGKRPIVLLHGFAGSLYSFRKLAPLLAETRDVYAFDLPGFGLSDKPVDHDYRAAGQARVVSGFLSALKLNDVAVAGHSMGGPIAMHAAITDPRITRLVFLDAGIIDNGVPVFVEYMVFPFPRFAARMFAGERFRRRMLEKSFHDPRLVTDDLVNSYLEMASTEGFMDGWTAMMKQYSSAPELPFVKQIRVPTLLVWGAFDRSNPPANAERIHGDLPGSTLVVVPEAGHYVHEEQPAAVAQAIERFLSPR